MNFNFGEVLTRAWHIIWKHKVLWIFGILASCSQGSSGFNGNTGGGGGGDRGGFGQPDLPPEVMRWFQVIEQNLVTFIVILCVVVLLIWVVTVFLGTIGKIGLIRGTFQADSSAESLVFGQLFSESTPYFWRMFGLSLIVAIPVIVFVAVLVVGLLLFVTPLSVSSGSDPTPAFGLAILPLLIGCFCLLVPVMFVVGMIFRQAERAIVLEEMSVLPSISRGWELFRNNFGPIILMAIILAVIGFAVGLVIAIPFFIIVFPAMIAYVAGEAQSSMPLILMGVCLCLYIPVSVALQGILIAYTESAWTLTYMRLTKPQANESVTPLEANA